MSVRSNKTVLKLFRIQWSDELTASLLAGTLGYAKVFFNYSVFSCGFPLSMSVTYFGLSFVLVLGFDFIQQPTDGTALAGLPFSLNCRSPSSYPAANITWYKDGARVTERKSDSLFAMWTLDSGDLYWENIQLTDAGTYTCVAVNDFYFKATRASRPAVVVVQGFHQSLTSLSVVFN